MKLALSARGNKSLIKLAIACLLPSSSLAQSHFVAWVDNPNYLQFNIERNGKRIENQADLLACDIVHLLDEQAKISISFSNGSRYLLDSEISAKKVEIPCAAKRSFSDKAFDTLKAISGNKKIKRWFDNESESVVTRSPEKANLSVSFFGNYTPYLTAGQRTIYLTWAGGMPPFTVEFKRTDNKLILAKSSGILTNNVSLPTTTLQSGQYTLSIIDTNKIERKDDSVTVIDESMLPPPPQELLDAKLQKEEYDLIYTIFLEGIGKGEWRFEALQRAAALQQSSPISKAWLERRFQ